MISPCRQSNLGKYPTGFGRVSNPCCHGAIRASSESAGFVGSREADANRFRRVRFSRPLCMCCAPAANGRRCPRVSAAPARYTNTSKSGGNKDFSSVYGARVWPNTTSWKASLGNGKAWTGHKAKLRWRRRRWETTRRIGGKKGTKRSLLVDGRGAPLSLIVAGANRHDVKLLAQTLDAIMIRRPKPTKQKPQNLCVDKGYRGRAADQQMRARGYIPHIPKQTPPKGGHKTKGRARRWVVERTHSWMNNFRKVRVRYEKRVANFEALLHLATAIICWRM
jgi:putative transposase